MPLSTTSLVPTQSPPIKPTLALEMENEISVLWDLHSKRQNPEISCKMQMNELLNTCVYTRVSRPHSCLYDLSTGC